MPDVSTKILPRSWFASLALLVPLALGCGGSKTGGGDTPDGAPAGTDVIGCDGAKLLANPSPEARGPWAVGARTVTIDGLTTEIWYPAQPGSDAGKDKARYDIRLELPASERSKISDTDNPWQDCDCVRELPLDTAHGPYPVVLFVHGTAAFRHQSLPIVTHWASRGFVVIAADHPGLALGDLLSMACGGSPPAQDLSGNLDSLLAAIASPSDDLEFLAGHLDATRVAVTGHSAGAGAAAAASGKPGVQVVISLAGAGSTAASSTLKSTLYLGGKVDQIATWSRVRNAWMGSATPRRLVGIENGGHLNFSDLCETKNAAGKNLLEIANANNVCGANLAGFLFDCDPTHLDGPSGWAIVDYASSAVLESTLQCQPPVDLNGLMTALPHVSDYQEAL